MCGAVFPDIMNNFGPLSKFFFLSTTSTPAIDLTYFQAAKVHFFSLGRWNFVLLAASAREVFKKAVGGNCLIFLFVCLISEKSVGIYSNKGFNRLHFFWERDLQFYNDTHFFKALCPELVSLATTFADLCGFYCLVTYWPLEIPCCLSQTPHLQSLNIMILSMLLSEVTKAESFSPDWQMPEVIWPPTGARLLQRREWLCWRKKWSG